MLLQHYNYYYNHRVFGEYNHWWEQDVLTTVSYPMSGPIRECLLSSARAWALVRLAVGSLFTAKMRSPTPSRPSRLMEPPWMMLRISIPGPSFMALTVIPVRSIRSDTFNVWNEPRGFYRFYLENPRKGVFTYLLLISVTCETNVICVSTRTLFIKCILGIENPKVFNLKMFKPEVIRAD